MMCYVINSLAPVILPSTFHANVVAIDNGELRKPSRVEVPLSSKIHEFRNAIYSGLQSHGMVGPILHDDLEILPLQDIPSLPTLHQKNLARLRDDTHAPGDLPTQEASEYFGPEKSDGIHFLVWLPLINGEFHWPLLRPSDCCRTSAPCRSWTAMLLQLPLMAENWHRQRSKMF